MAKFSGAPLGGWRDTQRLCVTILKASLSRHHELKTQQ